MSFGKSMLIAVGATGTSMGAVAVAGLLTNTGPFAIGSDGERAAQAALLSVPVAERTVFMEPVPLDPRGYSLNRKELEPGDKVLVAVEIVVRRKIDRKTVCKLMPRLRAAILRDLGPRVWSAPMATPFDETAANGVVHASFNGALGEPLIRGVTVKFIDDRRQATRSNCLEALHGGWMTWLRSDLLSGGGN